MVPLRGNCQWAWQRDFFDHIYAGAVFGALAKAGKLSQQMHGAHEGGLERMPGWVRRSDFDWYPSIADKEA